MAYHVLIILSCLLAHASAALTDEMQVYEQECLGEDRFHCMDGSCIWLDLYCDGNNDCSDGSDETLCLAHRPEPQLCNQTHQYLCEDGKKCIPSTWMCNNATECEDASDEANCTTLPESLLNSTCHGFLCGSSECVSRVWACDGNYDCADRSDEDPDTCRHAQYSRLVQDWSKCEGPAELGARSYSCLDSSYCLPEHLMCDGMSDCRDGSDEGPFCANWHKMCDNFKCGGNATCTPQRDGPICICPSPYTVYNLTTEACDDANDCAALWPKCSHVCENKDGHFTCRCDPGYVQDTYQYLCYAPDPEAMLFFSTRNDIRYFKVKSRQTVIVATGIKQAHGVSYDGKFLYWVETAQGHQSIVRAHLENVAETKEVLVGLGLEDPGDVAVDWLGGHIYFSDAERGLIAACRTDGSMCTTLRTLAKVPKYVTLDPKNGKMYWADWHDGPVLMSALMDGSRAEPLAAALRGFATGLAADAPGGRLYFVDGTVRVFKLDDGKVYSLFQETMHHPYSVAVFENTVYWSDWASNTVQATDKLHGTPQKGRYAEPYKLDTPVYGMHIYHPVIMDARSNPCGEHICSHFCFVTSNETHSCACPDGMELNGTNCRQIPNYRPQYLVVGGGSRFTRVQYNTLGNPESHATHFDIGRVQAMAYDSMRDNLYLYDGQRKTIVYISMIEFTLGVTHLLLYRGLDNVVDMDYDHVSDSLYFVDAGRRYVDVVSLRTYKRATVHRFDNEIPIALCLLPDYGRMLVAVKGSEQDNDIHIDSIGLDGSEVQHIVMNDLKGPHVRLQYAYNLNNVYLADETKGVIDYMHPEGTGRENFVELSTTVTSLAVTDNLVFWTDRRSSRLYWSDVHEASHRIRRVELSIFPNTTHLHIQSATPFFDYQKHFHPCQLNPCTDICVQTPYTPGVRMASTGFTFAPEVPRSPMGYKCLCPPGLLNIDGNCTELVVCKEDEKYCHKSNVCYHKSGVCDGKKDCLHGEDEEKCLYKTIIFHSGICAPNEYLCNGVCLDRNRICTPDIVSTPSPIKCSSSQFKCVTDQLCVERSQMCDGLTDCPDGSDEAPGLCQDLDCLRTEFTCAAGSCILGTFKCDGEYDCIDGSDEFNCVRKACAQGFYQCRDGECVELRRRCDRRSDCADGSDEEDCDEPDLFDTKEESENCAVWEHTCELNRSICVPLTARCNGKVDCPGNTDEIGCGYHCESSWGFLQCAQEFHCVPRKQVCDGSKDCSDGSDETPDACDKVNRTSHFYPAPVYTSEECRDGFRCGSGKCIEWRDVCDHTINCFDGSDEGGLCLTACENNTCSDLCQPSPAGAVCRCNVGYGMRADERTCVDVDECAGEVCSQRCHNVPGSFLCSCHHGYALRSDRRSCKATKGNMSVLYVTGNSVRSITADGFIAVEYNDPNVASITDMDVNVRMGKLYVTSAEAGKLLEVNRTHSEIVVTNIGRPTKVAVDWVTGNVYFVDTYLATPCIKVCNIRRKRCASLQKLTSNSDVTALVVDPASRNMFYCITKDLESVVWSATLAGQRVQDLAAVHNCTGLAVDSFKRRLYVAETGPAHIMEMDYEGGRRKKLLTNDPHLQAPHGLSIFEDHIYFLVANSFKLSRCQLYGQKHCEVYLQRVFDANTFALRHESVQRDDVRDVCEDFNCENVCTLGEAGPQCLCNDGGLSRDGSCAPVAASELPLFNGWSFPDFVTAHHVSFTLVTSVLVLFALYLCVFVYYHFVYKKKRDSAATYMPVHFQNSMAEGMEGLSPIPTPILQLPTTGCKKQEFVNPFQFFQSVWRQSYRKTLPVGTAALAIDVPGLDLSDTESDLDNKEQKRNILRK